MDKKMVIYLLIIITSFVIVINSSLIIHNITVQRNVEEENSNSTTIGGIVTNINEKTEYNDYTGNWFGEGKGNIVFGISAGEMEPNTEVVVSLMAISVDEVDLFRDVRFQLTKRDKNDKLIKIVEEEKTYIDTITSATYKEYFSTRLPDLENTYYMLSTEILGENGQVEDTVVTKIYVPETVK